MSELAKQRASQIVQHLQAGPEKMVVFPHFCKDREWHMGNEMRELKEAVRRDPRLEFREGEDIVVLAK
jgi:hypothetical protein